MQTWVYFLLCSDGSLYVGSTTDLTKRLDQHQSGFSKEAYTYKRRPVVLLKAIVFENTFQALEAEHKIKKWKKSKKWAFINGDQEAFLRESRNSATRRREERKKRIS